MALERAQGDGDAKSILSKARQVGLAGRGGRGDDGRAIGDQDWVVVQQRRCASGWSMMVAMTGVVASVRRGEESSEREMKWEQQQHVT